MTEMFGENLRAEVSSEDAARRLTDYLNFTGAEFERYGRNDAPHRVTADDIVAVTMLSIWIKPSLKRGLSPERIIKLERQAGRISDILQWVPDNLDLSSVSETEFQRLFGPDGHVRKLFTLLSSDLELGNVVAHKILARKRPRLIPIRDSRSERVLGHPQSWWRSWWEAMSDPALVDRLEELRRQAECERFSILRTADVVVWMKQPNQPDTSDEDFEVGEG